jgi:hypothetical protein
LYLVVEPVHLLFLVCCGEAILRHRTHCKYSTKSALASRSTVWSRVTPSGQVRWATSMGRGAAFGKLPHCGSRMIRAAEDGAGSGGNDLARHRRCRTFFASHPLEQGPPHRPETAIEAKGSLGNSRPASARTAPTRPRSAQSGYRQQAEGPRPCATSNQRRVRRGSRPGSRHGDPAENRQAGPVRDHRADPISNPRLVGQRCSWHQAVPLPKPLSRPAAHLDTTIRSDRAQLDDQT